MLHKKYIIDPITIASGESEQTIAFPMSSRDGMYSAYLEIEGDGDLEVEEIIAVKSDTFKSIEGRDSLATDLTDESGDGSDGAVNLCPTNPLGYCTGFKLNFKATSDSVTVSGVVLVR
jgi:hypothetical protein